MMQQCWIWMMSLGAVAMLLGALVALFVLAIVAIKRLAAVSGPEHSQWRSFDSENKPICRQCQQ